MTDKQKMIKARALVARGWCKGQGQRLVRGVVHYCAWNALTHVAGGYGASRIARKVMNTNGAGPQASLINANDRQSTRKAQVLRWFDNAIKAER